MNLDNICLLWPCLQIQHEYFILEDSLPLYLMTASKNNYANACKKKFNFNDKCAFLEKLITCVENEVISLLKVSEGIIRCC